MIVFLKLGGSLITEKTLPQTPRLDIIERLGVEIAAALAGDSDLQLVLGHGSGSFGHVAAEKHRTREGVRSPDDWRGFAEVWYQAARLNRFVLKALHRASIPAIVFPPSALITSDARVIRTWNLDPLRASIKNGLVPVVYGDVVFDKRLGGTIFSTEDLMSHIARRIKPGRILLAGIEPGVWADYPACNEILGEITPESITEVIHALKGSSAPDVTGGMASKVTQMLALAREIPGLNSWIFSGETPGAVQSGLLGTPQGTRIWAPPGQVETS